MAPMGKTVKDVPADKFVVALAAHFKKNEQMSVPAWAEIVKTGMHKELPPQDPDWYYVRAAAIARRVYLRGGSVGGFIKVFGGKKRDGAKRSHFQVASKSVVRRILQQLEEMKIVAKADKGRRITSTGQRELDTIASQVEVSEPSLLITA